MSLLDRLLPGPDFVVRDPDAVTRQMVAQYEALTGKTLYPAQVERLLVDVIAYRESLMREAVQDAAKLNLVRYSRAPILDYLGENIGVGRLPAAPARTTLRFTFSPAPVSSTLLPEGVVVEGGEVSFACLAQTMVPPGALSIDVEAACTQAGIVGNGFLAGQIKTLSGSLPGLSVESVQNITTSAGGADAEDDEHLRERIVLAPEQFSNAGSSGAYRFFALSAHADVIDVAVVSPTPGVVNIHPLVKTGLPSAAVKAAVLAACNAQRVRPLTDQVLVLDPVVVDYTITAQLTLFSTADAALALSEAQRAVAAYRDRQQSRLGLDVVRTQIIEVLQVYGVYSVALPQPALDQVLPDQGWPRCTAITITVAATVQG